VKAVDIAFSVRRVLEVELVYVLLRELGWRTKYNLITTHFDFSEPTRFKLFDASFELTIDESFRCVDDEVAEVNRGSTGSPF
jgi:hypothetical protein